VLGLRFMVFTSKHGEHLVLRVHLLMLPLLKTAQPSRVAPGDLLGVNSGFTISCDMLSLGSPAQKRTFVYIKIPRRHRAGAVPDAVAGAYNSNIQ
jgi:hypothetical protein